MRPLYRVYIVDLLVLQNDNNEKIVQSLKSGLFLYKRYKIEKQVLIIINKNRD